VLEVRRAAAALGLTQPALSKSLRRLELALEAKLVRRTPNGVALTAEGEALASHVHRLRLSLDDVTRELRDVRQGRVGLLRIGSAPGIADYLLPAPCTALLKDGAQVTINVTIGNNNVLLPGLRNGELDLIVSGMPDAPYEDLVQERLYDDEFIVFASATHPLAACKKVAIADLVRWRWASTANVLAWQWLQRTFQNHSLPPPRIALETGSQSLRSLIAASSDLLCFNAKRAFCESAQHLPLVELPVKDLKWIRHVGVSHRRNAYLSPAARRFIEILKATAKDIDRNKR